MLSELSSRIPLDPVSLRPFAEADAAQVRRLAHDGLLPGHVDHSRNATSGDPTGSAAGYPDADSFWIVEHEQEIIGTIALIEKDATTANLLQLRVAPHHKADPTIARMLVRAATHCARQRGMLKIAIESPGLEIRVEPEESAIVTYLRDLGFEYSRTHQSDGRTMLEFYLNLYEGTHDID